MSVNPVDWNPLGRRVDLLQCPLQDPEQVRYRLGYRSRIFFNGRAIKTGGGGKGPTIKKNKHFFQLFWPIIFFRLPLESRRIPR